MCSAELHLCREAPLTMAAWTCSSIAFKPLLEAEALLGLLQHERAAARRGDAQQRPLEVLFQLSLPADGPVASLCLWVSYIAWACTPQHHCSPAVQLCSPECQQDSRTALYLPRASCCAAKVAQCEEGRHGASARRSLK